MKYEIFNEHIYINPKTGAFCTICKYKQHLILSSMYFANRIYKTNQSSYEEIYKFCVKINNRRKIDQNLLQFLELNPSLGFVEGKKRYDEIQ